MSDEKSRKALGQFIRAHRERMSVPVAGSSRRRTPGMRREELADASKVSLTWLSWLEQGRSISVSANALGRLADSLSLNPGERSYLLNLAGKRDPSQPQAAKANLPEAILKLPHRMTIPAYLIDRTWTAISWNAAATDLFKGWLDGDNDRNLMRYIFFSAQAARLISNWDDRARRVVAEFRSDFSCSIHNQEMQALVEELNRGSPAFRRLWQEQSVLEREGGERGFNEPSRLFYQTTLIVSANPDLRLITLSPSEEEPVPLSNDAKTTDSVA